MGLDRIVSGGALRVELQTHLPNGVLNANVGRPFAVAYSKAGMNRYDRDTARHGLL